MVMNTMISVITTISRIHFHTLLDRRYMELYLMCLRLLVMVFLQWVVTGGGGPVRAINQIMEREGYRAAEMLIAIRKHNAEFDEMCDLKTLKQWARTGEVHPNDLIKEDGEWVPASQASVLKGFFAAAAWDVSEDVLWTPQLSQRDSEAKLETDSNITEAKENLTSLQNEANEARHVPVTPKLNKSESHSDTSTDEKKAPQQIGTLIMPKLSGNIFEVSQTQVDRDAVPIVEATEKTQVQSAIKRMTNLSSKEPLIMNPFVGIQNWISKINSVCWSMNSPKSGFSGSD